MKAVTALTDETRALQVDKIIEKQRGISGREKKFLFNYLSEGDIPETMRIIANNPEMNLRINEDIESYKTNVYEIVTSFFTYGFIPVILEQQAQREEQKRNANFFDQMRRSLSTDASVDADEDYQEA